MAVDVTQSVSEGVLRHSLADASGYMFQAGRFVGESISRNALASGSEPPAILEPDARAFRLMRLFVSLRSFFFGWGVWGRQFFER